MVVSCIGLTDRISIVPADASCSIERYAHEYRSISTGDEHLPVPTELVMAEPPLTRVQLSMDNHIVRVPRVQIPFVWHHGVMARPGECVQLR